MTPPVTSGGFGPEHVSSPEITRTYALLHAITPSRAPVVVVVSQRCHDEVVAHGPDVYERDGADAAPVRWVAALLAIGGVRGYGP